MYTRSLQILLLVMLVPAIFIACGMKKAPDDEQEEKKGKPRTGAQVYQTSSLGGEVYSLTGSDMDGVVLGVPSVSVYNYMDAVKETLSKEPRINVDQACLEILSIGQTNPLSLEADVVVNQDCASLPEGEASHTDPSPLDGNDSWIICGPPDSGLSEDTGDGTTGSDSGGNSSGDNADNAGASEKPGQLGSLQEILCTPAVGPQPDVDPRLVYPSPDKADGMLTKLLPCVGEFCPWKLIPTHVNPDEEPDDPLNPDTSPIDPIDPNPDDIPELDESIKAKLPCDKIVSLCEPNLTLISKNDLVKGDSGDQDVKDSDEWNECDGKKDDGSSRLEFCEVGNVADDDSDWKVCGYHTTSDSGSEFACVTHIADPDESKGESEYTVTTDPNLGGISNSDSDDLKESENKSIDLVIYNYETTADCSVSGQGANGKKITNNVNCN